MRCNDPTAEGLRGLQHALRGGARSARGRAPRGDAGPDPQPRPRGAGAAPRRFRAPGTVESVSTPIFSKQS